MFGIAVSLKKNHMKLQFYWI